MRTNRLESPLAAHPASVGVVVSLAQAAPKPTNLLKTNLLKTNPLNTNLRAGYPHAAPLSSQASRTRQPNPNPNSTPSRLPSRHQLRNTPAPLTAHIRSMALDAAADLRRVPDRDTIETLLQRARYLMPEDGAILIACYQDGLRISDLANLRQMSIRTMRRHIKRLAIRIISPIFEYVMLYESSWPATRARIARAVYLEGQSLRAVADSLHMSLHIVRRQAQCIRAIYEDHAYSNSAPRSPRRAI